MYYLLAKAVESEKKYSKLKVITKKQVKLEMEIKQKKKWQKRATT